MDSGPGPSDHTGMTVSIISDFPKFSLPPLRIPEIMQPAQGRLFEEASRARMQYFVVMIDYGRRGREAVVDPEITRREVISRITSGEYANISFIHEIADSSV